MPYDASRREDGLQTRLRLAEQFQLVRVSPREFKLVSLYDAISVGAPEGRDGVLDRLLPALQRGADLKSLLRGASRPEATLIRRTIRDFLERGLVEEIRRPADDSAPDRYRAQRQFFANFQPVAGMDAGPETAMAGGADLQGELKRATVMVVGLGRVGSRVCQALASAGVGRIVGVDGGLVGACDLADSAYAADDLGQARTTALARRLSALNADVDFQAAGPAPSDEPELALAEGATLACLCEDVFAPARHDALNRACLAAKVPWIGYRAYGTRIEIGPSVIPGETACFRCYELRRASNFEGFEAELALRAQLAATETGLGSLNITLGADILALEIVKSLTHFTAAATYGAVYTLDIATMEGRVRPLLKIPRCPACGRAARTPAIHTWRYDTEGEADAL